ncbi:MAG: Nif3-like dinuclear metal center hexameric protein [Acidimicrobiia bacterium]|nr:Nif3-like dinuclear metal center hexameric protein [Acidimicrobiia bacterium]
MRVAELVDRLDARFPLGNAQPWDPVGLQLGWPDNEVGAIAVCHEVTPTVVERAVAEGLATLVAYHPLLFEPTTRLVAGPTASGRALTLAASGVSVIAVHTAMDAADPGTGDALMAALDIEVSGRWASDEEPETAIGRWGTVPDPMDVEELATRVHTVLGGHVRVTHGQGTVRTVAVLPGSGGRAIQDAGRVADAIVTGDVSHHAAAAAAERGMAVIDPGHAATERPGIASLYAAVSQAVDGAILFEEDPTPWEV